MSINPCTITRIYRGGDRQDNWLGPRIAVWLHVRVRVCGFGCGIGWTPALSVTTAPLRIHTWLAALYKCWTFTFRHETGKCGGILDKRLTIVQWSVGGFIARWLKLKFHLTRHDTTQRDTLCSVVAGSYLMMPVANYSHFRTLTSDLI